jgi:hypothetical protein
LATTGRGRGLVRGLSAAIAATAFGCTAQAEPVEGPPSTSQNDPGWFRISGTLGSMTYYERVAISPACPDVFNAIRLKYPQAIERELDRLVTRVSSSLRAVCPSRVE